MHPNQEKPSLEHFSISPRSSYMWRECKDIFKQKNLKYYCFLFLDLECFILAKPFLLVGHHLHDLLVPHLLDHIGVREDVTEKKFLLGIAQIAPPPPHCTQFGQILQLCFCPKNRKCQNQFGQSGPPATHYLGNFFTF